MGVAPGSPVSAANTNAHFLDSDADDTGTGIYAWANTNPISGSQIDNTQREHNAHASFIGVPINSIYNILPTWTDNQTGLSTDPLFTRTDHLSDRFNNSTGHKHTGVSGDAPPVSSIYLADVPFHGYVAQGTDLVSISGGSTDVSTELFGKTPSTGVTVQGVVVNAPYNKILLRYASGSSENDQILDGSGNVVYGRLTESVGVWTLTYYVDLSGTETPYSIPSPIDIRWYYQELFNPIVDAPVYSEFAVIPSDNATQDVVDATSTQRGLVSAGTQSFGGIKTFVNTTQSTDKDTGCVVLEGGLGVEKNINAGGTILGSNLSGTNTGDVTLTAVGSSPNANAASLSGQILTLQPADGSFPGVVTTGTQTFAGNKTFTGTISASNFSGSSTGTNTGDVTLGTFGSSPNGSGASLSGQVLTLQPADGTNPGGVSTGTQTFAGNKTFSGTISASNFSGSSSGTNTGDQTITLTGDVTGSGTSSFATTISSNSVTNTKLADMATQTFKGRTTAGTGDPEDLTATQATAILNNFVGDSGSGGTKGLVPAPAAGDAAANKFLKADGTWATTSGGGGGGGGMALTWIEGSNSPVKDQANNIEVYYFQIGLAQSLYALIKIPQSYTSGTQIFMYSAFYNPDSSSTVLMQTIATLIRTGTDAITSTANQRTSTNTFVTLTGGTVNKPQAVTFDLTSSSGQINGVSVSAGDYIIVQLTRGTDGAGSDVAMMNEAAEVTFS